MIKLLKIFTLLLLSGCVASNTAPPKPRILISSDIGGTDPDDNQSMIHFLMYSDLFQTEGLISSASYGEGSKEEILKMIDLYEEDLPILKKHNKAYPSPDSLRAVCKQGSKDPAPAAGYQSPTEGSEWIVRCANKKSKEQLCVLVWGGLDDVAQALHDAPEIADKIKVYWIGGPNKKWSTNSYAYIVKNFPDLWFIEANATYRGFFSDKTAPEDLKNDAYYEAHIRGAGALGKAFKNYYGGRIKMGDTPSLLYVMHGDPNDPAGESWGGSFEAISNSAKRIFKRPLTNSDTVPVYGIMAFNISGPQMDIAPDSACLVLHVAGQDWNGYHLGDGEYMVRYSPKRAEDLNYTITSNIPGFPKQEGAFVVANQWPGKIQETDYQLGPYWYSDKSDTNLFGGEWQGAKTITKWRDEALNDWAKRWAWLQH